MIGGRGGMTTEHAIRTGLDIGTSTVTAVMAEAGDGRTFRIAGIGRAPSNGLRRGVIVNLDRTTEAVARALADAEMMAGVAVESVCCNIDGDHIRGVNSRGVIAVSHHSGEITADDVERVLQAARAIPVSPDREVLHVLPQEFIVDGQGGIKNPVGMIGTRLEVAVHIITASMLSVGNVRHCVREAGYELESITLSSLAAAEAALNERDREMGVALVDIGAGLTTIVLIIEDAVRHTAAVALGGRNVTNDLAIGLRAPIEAAEAIKHSAGVAIEECATQEKSIEVPGVGDQPVREVSQRVIAAIIGPRLEEILQLAKAEIRRAPGGDILTGGIVLTGGSAAIPGVCALAERIFDLPVRVAQPLNLEGLTNLIETPTDLTALGLISQAGSSETAPKRSGGMIKRTASRIANVLSQLI